MLDLKCCGKGLDPDTAFIEEKSNQKSLYCLECGKYIKNLNKREYRLWKHLQNKEDRG